MKIADKRPRRAALPSLLAAAVLLLASQSARAAEREVDLELVLAADISGSMDLEEATLQRHGFASALRHPKVVAVIRHGPLGRIAVTYVEWAGTGHQSTLVDWAEVSDATSAGAFAQAILRPKIKTKIWTSISQVITSAAGSFANNGFQGLRHPLDTGPLRSPVIDKKLGTRRIREELLRQGGKADQGGDENADERSNEGILACDRKAEKPSKPAIKRATNN